MMRTLPLLAAAALLTGLAAAAPAQQSTPDQRLDRDQQAATPQTTAPRQRGPAMDLKALDKDGDGTVSRDEFLAGHTQGRFEAADKNGDGTVTLDEFTEADRQHREARFKQLDANSDGKLSRDEMDARATAMFDRMDRNHDGKLEASEMTGPKQKR